MRSAATVSSVLGVVVLGGALAGCNGWDEGRALSLDRLSRTSLTGGSEGFARVKVPLSGVEGKFLLASSVVEGDQTIYVERVEDDKGNLLRRFMADVEIDELRTGAVARQELNHLNWPIGLDDPDLSGEEVSVYLGAVNADDSLALGVEVQVDVLLSEDKDFDRGNLKVNIHYAEGLQDDAEYSAAVEQAVAYMQSQIYEAVGLVVVVEYLNWDGGTLPRPGFGAPEDWFELTNSTDSDLALDLVVVDTIAGSDPTILGAAGSIPGGLLASHKSGMILSASANAGPDLVYSPSEIDLLGSTMAHELGHMLGLFHPVERTYERWDALDDTEKCESEGACQGALGTNLMYPTALCTQSTCVSQTDLSEEQAGVLHRYTGVF